MAPPTAPAGDPSAPQKSTTDRSLALSATRAGVRMLSSLSPAVATRAATTLFCLPRRHARPEIERRVLEQAEPVPLRLGRTVLRGWRWGSGPTVLLVHGWEGRGSQLQAFVDPLVERGFSVLTWDAPGHGDSPGRLSSVIEFCDALWVAARASGPLHGVLAHSAGAVATALAASEGLAPRRAAFVAPPRDIGNYLRRFSDLLTLPAHIERRMVDHMQARFGVHLDELDVRRFSLPHDLPLLVVHDRDDKEVPVEQGEAVAAAWPGARIVHTEGLGHRRLLKDPGTVATLVDWIASDGP